MKKILSFVAASVVLICLAVWAHSSSCTGFRVSNECIPAENILDGTLGASVSGSGCGATNLPQGVSITHGLTASTATTTDTGATSLVVGGGITAGTGSVAITGTNGKLAAFDSTHYSNLSGANLTSIPAAAIVAGSLGSGAFTVTGAFNATTSISAGSGLNSIGAVTVSTSATSTDSMKFLGTVMALPTSTYNSGVFAKLAGDGKVYVSTMSPVTAAGDWKALW